MIRVKLRRSEPVTRRVEMNDWVGLSVMEAAAKKACMARKHWMETFHAVHPGKPVRIAACKLCQRVVVVRVKEYAGKAVEETCDQHGDRGGSGFSGYGSFQCERCGDGCRPHLRETPPMMYDGVVLRDAVSMVVSDCCGVGVTRGGVAVQPCDLVPEN